MIRDRGPISSLGFGVTSRDIPLSEGETEGPSPNSGYVAKALNGHPVMRFVANTTFTMAGALVASRLIKGGGLKLGKFIQTTSESGGEFAGAATRFVESAGKIKKALDELEGVTRSIEGVDPTDVYSKLVFQIDGKVAKQNLQRLQGGLFHLEGNQYLTTREIRRAGSGITREPAAVWSLRDDIQQTLTKRARNLAVELPALYVTQRAVTDPLFGSNEDRKRVKWYNPVDVIADFSKQSAINMMSMLTPFDLGGAAVSRVKFLAAAPTSKNPNLKLSARQTRYSNAILDVKTIISAFGQDLEKVVGGLVRNTTAMNAAFTTAVREGGAAEGNIVFAMRQASSGRAKASAAASASGVNGKLRKASASVKAYLFGYQVDNPNDPDFGTRFQGFVDAIPSLKGVSSGVVNFRTRFKAARSAYDVINGTISYDQALSGLNQNKELLSSSIRQVRSQHSSKFSDYAQSVITMMGPSAMSEGTLSRGKIGRDIETQEYRNSLYRELLSQGVDEDSANTFVRKIGLSDIPKKGSEPVNISQRIQFGSTKIIDENSTKDFYQQLVNRIYEHEGHNLGGLTGGPINPDALLRAVRSTDTLFRNDQFQQRLQRKIDISYKTFYDEIAIPTGAKLTRAQKATYEDFVGNISQDKTDYLANSAAEAVGIKLLDEQGNKLSRSEIQAALARRGIDASNLGELRAFLIQQKRMSSSISSGGFNLLGLKPLLIDEAFSMRLFGNLGEDELSVVENLASEIARRDPISATIGYSELKGVYKTKSGAVLDLTRIQRAGVSTLKFLRDQTQIPIVKFNPLDMIGYGGAQGIDERQMFATMPSKSFQPFVQVGSETSDLLVYAQERRGFFGPVGSLYSIRGNQSTDTPRLRKIQGQFKQFATNENDMFSRTARIVAGRQNYLRIPQEAALSEDDMTVGQKIRKRLDVAREQPNSLFRFLDRFKKRKTDIYNPVVFGQLLRDKSIETRRGGRLDLVRDQDSGLFTVVDESGQVRYDHRDVLTAYESFRRGVQSYGTPVQIIKQTEKKYSSEQFLINQLSGSTEKIGLSDVRSEADMREFAALEIARAEQTSAVITSSDQLDTRSLTAAAGIVRSKLQQFDLEEISPKSTTSPTISTRVDELREAILQLALQRRSFEQAISTGSLDVGQFAIEIEEIISQLVTSKRITANQAAEARAAGLSTVLNFVAFSKYKRSATESQNLSEALSGLMDLASDPRSTKALGGLVSPFIDQRIANVGTAGIGNDLISLFRPFVRRELKPADYRLSGSTVNELGNQGTVFVPTFGASVSSVGISRATKSALGFSTYEDAQAFSSGSVPISHGVQRLNKYFETFSLGLDERKYSGPIGLYGQGMVGKRAAPLVIGGTALLTADRTIGGLVNEKDERGERVYSPFFTTKIARSAVEAQAVLSGITPGGMSYEEKKQQLLEGEVPVKQGRYWPLGITPFKGGKTMYYRPSYYRRLQAGAGYTSESFGSPMERFAFGYDFSPLRPFDPYRFEREHYYDRPYPVTGEYFTGPWGPLTSVMNATVGKVLKPQRMMHDQEVIASMSQYMPAGQSGAYNPQGLLMTGKARQISGYGPGQPGAALVSSSVGSYGGSGQGISQSNARLANAGGMPLQTGSNLAFSSIANVNSQYVRAAQFGPPPVPGTVPPGIVAAGPPVQSNRFGIVAGEIGYRIQEMAGLYGFGFASVREKLGFGQGDFQPQRSLYQSASKAYGSTRSFWDLNLGGLGDLPASELSIEVSEIVRRFIPKERTDINYINPITNLMGQKYPFLPGADYFVNFQQGDPFTKVQEGEIRLPGIGYERLNPYATSYNDPVTQLDILADIAPYSKQFRKLNSQITMASLDPGQRQRVEEIRSQVEDATQKFDFSEYKYKYSSAEEMGLSKTAFTFGRMGEYIAHRDTFINTKLLPNRTAQEDWERRSVYGATFPEWQNPIDSFIKPMYYKSQNRNPLTSGLLMAGLMSQFARGPKARTGASLFGFVTGAGYSAYSRTKQAITGERFIPQERKKQLALEEYVDILSYVKNTRLSNEAKAQGDMAAAAQFSQAAKRTMYGADLENASVQTLSLAIPKRKREHFKAMINAPMQERERILSTAPRLERRIYEAAWGMKVESKPDLVDYFSRHELPDLGWEGWHPNTNMEHVKVKMGESMGINMSQMGYYPQQVREAQLVNPSYPEFQKEQNPDNVAAQIRTMMSRNGISGNVIPVLNGFGSSGIDIFSGVR